MYSFPHIFVFCFLKFIYLLFFNPFFAYSISIYPDLNPLTRLNSKLENITFVSLLLSSEVQHKWFEYIYSVINIYIYSWSLRKNKLEKVTSNNYAFRC